MEAVDQLYEVQVAGGEDHLHLHPQAELRDETLLVHSAAAGLTLHLGPALVQTSSSGSDMGGGGGLELNISH